MQGDGLGKGTQLTSHAPMDIGAWLRQMRRKRQFDLRDVAARTGLDIGTLSKIENRRTQATLGTLVRFCEGLGITVGGFLQDWQAKPFTLLSEVPLPNDAFIPTPRDIEALIAGLHLDRPSIMQWIANALNGIASMQGDVVPVFEPDVVEKLFFGPPWQRYEICYPSGVLPADVLAIIQQNGVLILPDIEAFLGKLESEQETPSEKLPIVFKGNRFAIGSVDRIKMTDVLLFDQALHQSGEIIALFWNVCLFQLHLQRLQALTSSQPEAQEVISAEQARRFAVTVIIICRWFQQRSEDGAARQDALWGAFRQLVSI